MVVELGKYMAAESLTNGKWFVKMKRGDSVLGIVAWYRPWRQWVFQPSKMTEFSADCMDCIVGMLKSLNKKGEGSQG